MLSIQDLVVTYGEVRAVDGLSLEIPEGSLYGLLGPNGAGKTTTLSCTVGLLQPARGTIRLQGEDVRARPRWARQQIGLVPQSLALYPSLTVVQNLRLFGGLFGLAGKRLRDRVAWGLSLAQLEPKAEARVGALSGGMKRRLNLACGLLHDPALVICDEPTAGVDPQSRNHLFETISRLHDEGRTVIYTTHYMEEVEALCERVAIVDHGRVIRQDSLDGLLAAVGKAKRFDLRLDEGLDAAELRARLDAAGIPVAELTEQRRSLEQVFLDLTGTALRDGGSADEG